MDRLKDKVCIITGSTKGIGKSIAKGYANEGANIVIVSRNQSQCDKVAAEIKEEFGVMTLGVKTDVTRIDEIKSLMNKTVNQFGKIDVLVNNAGSALTKKAEEITEDEWNHVVDLDLKSVFFCCQQAGLKMMETGGGSIINIASILGLVALKQVAPYCASKGGAIQLTKALSLEWAKHSIRVNALCPGYVITDINREKLSDEKIAGSLIRKTALGRLAEVEDMIEPAIFLAQDGSGYMTGQNLVIDGGWTAM
jgi:NAD(P)-dependent dehydrogenase (short-subunit alcohol dehydrogenase family)